MKKISVTTDGTRAIVIALAVAASLLDGAQTPVFAQGARALEGVWALSLTLRDCATGSPLGAPPERSLLTFHQGGTMSGTAGALAFAPGQRSDAHGVWTHAGGSTFRNRMVAIILFDTAPSPPASPGFQTGWQLIASTYTLSGANNLTVSARVDFFNASRTQYRSLCSAGTGERFR